MSIRGSIAVALLAGCGRIGFDATPDAAPDGSSDAPAPCAAGPWSIVSHVIAAATASDDWEPALSPNGLVLVWSSSSTQPSRLHVATRATTGGTFGTARELAELRGQQATDGAFGPMWSHDGSKLYFIQVSSTGATPMLAPYLGGGVFGTPAPSDLPAAGNNWAMSADELEVFYTVQIAANDFDLGHATRATTTSPWATDTLLDGFNRRGAGMREGWPSFDDARQELYVEYSVSPGTDALELARRPGPGLAFGPLAPIAELGPDGDDPDITDDGMTLVFAANRAGGAGKADIYIATRACQ